MFSLKIKNIFEKGRVKLLNFFESVEMPSLISTKKVSFFEIFFAVFWQYFVIHLLKQWFFHTLDVY